MKKTGWLVLHSLLALTFISCSNNIDEDLTLANNETSQIEGKTVDSIEVNGGIQFSQKVSIHQYGYIGRYWKSSGNDFLYSGSPDEAPNDYSYQMNIGKAYSGGNVSLGRWFNPSTGDRLLTITNEVSNNPAYIFEGEIGIASTTPFNEGTMWGTHPVYRYRKYNGGRHLFTVDFNELGGGNSYWIYEGIAFHMYYN